METGKAEARGSKSTTEDQTDRTDIVYKIKILNLRNVNVIFLKKMVSNQNVVNYKVS
jgi:hypothetical protein